MVFFSGFFRIDRECKQGDPISSYLFLLCAEIMGTMTRTSISIKGNVVSDREYKLLPYQKMLSTAGRITVIKSLVLPKITYLLISVPNLPTENKLKKKFFEFI
jgi:hypothetical protein